MNTIRPELIDPTLERFYYCVEGVIRRVTLSFRASAHPTIISVILSVRDSLAVAAEGWV
jgi:hypothetical protein